MKFSFSRENIYTVLLFLTIFSATIGFKFNGLVIIILSIFYLLDNRLFKKLKNLKNKIPYLFFVYLAFHLIGYFFSENKNIALHEIEVRLPFLFLPLIIFTENISKNNIYKIFVVFKYWLIFLAVFLISYKLIKIGGPISTLVSYSLSYLTSIHHSYFSLFYVFAICFTIHQLNISLRNKNLRFLEIGFLFFFIMLLGARVTSIFAFFIVLFLVFQKVLQFNSISKYFIIIGFGAILFFVYDSTVFKEKFARLAKVEWNIDKNIYNHQVFSFDYDDKTSNTLELRLIKWYSAYQIFKENTFFGVGSGDYLDKLYTEFHKIDFKKGMVYKYNTHNQFIEEFIKFGLLGGIFFLGLFGYIIYISVLKKNVLLFQIVLIISLFLTVESAFGRQHGVVFASFIIPILYIYDIKKPNI